MKTKRSSLSKVIRTNSKPRNQVRSPSVSRLRRKTRAERAKRFMQSNTAVDASAKVKELAEEAQRGHNLYLRHKAASHKRDRREDAGKSIKGSESTFLSAQQAEEVVITPVSSYTKFVKLKHLRPLPGSLNRFKMWMVRMIRGNKKDYRTPFFKGMEYEQIAHMIETKYVRPAQAKVKRMFSAIPRAWDYYLATQLAQIKKIGPKGLFPPFSVWGKEQVDADYDRESWPKSLNQRALRMAIRHLQSLVKPGSLVVQDPESCLPKEGDDLSDARLINTDTNSCFEDYVKGFFPSDTDSEASINRKLVKQKLLYQLRYVMKLAKGGMSFKELISLPEFHYVATASQRTVQRGHAADDPEYQGVKYSKCRLVIAMPKLDTLLGKPYLNALMEEALKWTNPDGTHPFIALSTPERIDKNMQYLLSTAKRAGLKVLSSDYSAFDQHIRPEFAWEIAKAISTWFRKDQRDLFLAIVWAQFYQTTLLSPLGETPEGPSRMKSGSIFTNILDSFCNFVTQWYGYYAGHYGKIISQFVQGDDALLLAPGLNPETFEKAAAEVGLEANASKQYYEDSSCSFLQKLHILGYPGGIYPMARAWNACLSLEDDVPIETSEEDRDAFPYILTFRTLARLDTAWADPLFDELVKAFQVEDKIRLWTGKDPHELARLAGAYASKWELEWALKPWKSPGKENMDFASRGIFGVLQGEVIPPPGKRRFQWYYKVPYDKVAV